MASLSALILPAAIVASAARWEHLATVPNAAPVPDPSPTSLVGLTVAGYQGWFATPDDDDDNGWVHWGNLAHGTGIEEDFWPEMAEFAPGERHVAPGYFHPNGTQAALFSSDSRATVARHFQWMEAYGIDGVAIQRFGVEVGALRHKRVLNYSLAAAAVTARVLFVEYDLSGMHEADIVPTLTKDWAALVAEGVTSNPRYLHQGGVPVVGVFGFYMDRFSAETATAILDIFQKDGAAKAFVLGAGQWYWFKANPTPAWSAVFYRMDAWSPWNMGNWNGDADKPQATSNYWAANKADMEKHGVIWMPELYPGCSTAHRDHKPVGSKGTRIPRSKGAFLWEQFAVATELKVQTAFVGMFDELDEGTMILKVVNDPPVQAAGDIGYEGMPSDVYLCWTGQGTKMLRGEIPYNTTAPDCPGLTQPTIPVTSVAFNSEPAQPPSVTFSWEPALALAGGGSVAHYEVLFNGMVRRTTDVSTTGIVFTLAEGTRASPQDWRVRAVNTLGNAGGWSLRRPTSQR